jgi:hypothetical protein
MLITFFKNKIIKVFVKQKGFYFVSLSENPEESWKQKEIIPYKLKNSQNSPIPLIFPLLKIRLLILLTFDLLTL